MPDDILREQIEYYRARAAEYDEWFYRQGRYDRGPRDNERWFAEADEVFDAYDDLVVTGEVLELAPGTGIWTERILRTASRVTAVDASEEMLAINREKLGADAARVTYHVVDLFEWEPQREYDAVVFGFWISHIPGDRLDSFLRTVASALRPGGVVFFVDGRREQLSTAIDQELPEEASELMTRELNDGRTFQIVKNFYQPRILESRFARARLAMTIRETATHFIYGSGRRADAV